MSEETSITPSSRKIPIDRVGVYLVLVANAMTWVPLAVLDRPRPHTEDAFFLFALLAGLLATLGIVFNIAGLITAIRTRTPKSTPVLAIIVGGLSILFIGLAVGYRATQMVFM